MDEITIGGKGFDGIIAKFSTKCVKTINCTFADGGCDGAEAWGSPLPDYSIDGNKIRMHADLWNGDNGKFRCCTCTISYTIYNDEESTSTDTCSKQVIIKQLSKNFAPSTSGESDKPEPGTPDCIRGTDNGDDMIQGQETKHPVLVCAMGGEDSDSAYVKNLQVNGMVLSTDPSNPTRIADWIYAYRDYDPDTVCGSEYGYIQYTFTQNPDTDMREAVVTWSTTDENVCDNAVPVAKYGIKNACSSWTITYRQAPCGYYWYGEHSKDKVLIPCGTAPENPEWATCYGECDCEEPGVTFSILIEGKTRKDDFTYEVKNGCEDGTFKIKLSADATFSVAGDGIKIDGNVSGVLTAGEHTVSFVKVNNNEEKSNVVTFVSGEKTIKMTVKRKCKNLNCTCNNMHVNIVDDVTVSGNMGNITNVDVSYNESECDPYLDNKVSWLDAEITGQTGHRRVQLVTKEENLTGKKRKGEIKFKVNESGGTCKTLEVFQETKKQSNWKLSIEFNNITNKNIYLRGITFTCREEDTTIDYTIQSNIIEELISGYGSKYFASMQFSNEAPVKAKIVSVSVKVSNTREEEGVIRPASLGEGEEDVLKDNESYVLTFNSQI